MKKLYKISILFLTIFLVGFYIAIKSMDSSYNTKDTNKTIIVTTNKITKATKV